MDGIDWNKAASSIRLGSLRAGSTRGASLRSESTSVWRNSGMDVFSKSVREEDDEEALKWASLEKLPTFDRLRKGLIFGSTGPSHEVDVDNLGPEDRKHLLDRLVKTADEDNEGFLLRLRDRLDRVGIDMPTIEVKYEHVTVEADVETGSRALPSFINFHIELFEGLLSALHLLPNSKRHITILDDCSGVIKPKRMTLLLGPPSSGKTSLLLAMAGTLAKELTVSGKVSYNGHELHEFVPERTSAYISQNDVHIGEMTVRETLAFSARIHLQTFSDMLAELSRRDKIYAKYLSGSDLISFNGSLLVGVQMLWGFYRWTRKRVTSGEMLVGHIKRFFFMDELSNGLDCSSNFSIVKSLKSNLLIILEGTAVISLLQPAPETYDLFDDIILLTDGKIVYQGPRENILEFFESMGFKCPARKGVADFLQEVTSKKDQQQYWMTRDAPYRFVTSKEFAEGFQSFHVCVMAFISATVFFRTELHKRAGQDPGFYTATLFFAVTMHMFNGMSEISMTIAKLPVFYKQRNFLFYPSWAYAIPSWIVKIPVSFIEAAAWTIITYYVTGFDPNIARFFKHFIILFLVNQMSSGLFRTIGAFGRNMIVANTFGSFALLIVFALGGFILARDDVKDWWLWGYWTSPLMYAMNGLMVNEFFGHSWDTPINGTTLGKQTILARAFFAEAYWYWIGIGGLIASILIYNLLYVVSLSLLGAYAKKKADVSSLNESDAAVELSSMNKEGEGNQNKKKGMILPFEPHSITFDDVKYSVDMPQEMKDQGVGENRLLLLKGVSGAFRPGVLTALMGVSGAGKTTLMDVLAGRKTGGYIEGDIKVSGYPKKQETFARISGYCEQNDIHSPHVTVYESLIYSAWLRLASDVDENQRKAFVDQVMDLVELNPLKDSLVGLPGVNGLSTEQRKRLTIAVELVANPSIIFMDEPTSGLDARAAAIVMRAVRNTVDTGRTVVCTIHQPSIDIFEAFDELFLMKRGGLELYVGPIGPPYCKLNRVH
ncbi:pleiotropic drug resistance protein 1-like protein [Tanacetum coccineum]